MRRLTRSGRSRHHILGFTLVELQIAMLIMTLIALLMAGALRATVQAWEKSTEHQDVAEHRFLVDQFLRRHLATMRFARFQYGDTGAMISFMGSNDAVHFVATYPGFESDGALYWWTLKNEWLDELERERLVLEYLPFVQGELVEYDPRSGVSIKDVVPVQLVLDDSIRLAAADYYVDDDTGLDGWLEEWEPGARIPQVVRLQLVEVDSRGEEIALPEIAIAPRFSLQQLTYLERD
jgi:type II secretory pathway pseudopilin PulG